MAQATITNYFHKRKRTDDVYNNKNKVIRVDQEELLQKIDTSEKLIIDSESRKDLTVPDSASSDESKVIENKVCRALIYENSKTLSGSESKNTFVEKSLKQAKVRKVTQPSGSRDIREILQKPNQTETAEKKETGNPKDVNVRDSEQNQENKSIVSFELKGLLSPKKYRGNRNDQPENKEQPANNEVIAGERSNLNNKAVIMEGLKTPTKKARSKQEVTLEQLKKKVHRSAKIMEMRKCFARLNNAEEEMKKLEKKKKDLEKPKLKTFQAIQIEVPTSPQKSIYSSPQKVGTSPQSTPTKLPAYQRYASLAAPSANALPLPFHYNHLAEVFRSVDTVSSMLHNRRERITFKKLKPAVQEMLRRNFLERHLGQIKKVYPNAYDFQQEKCRNFGSTSKTEQYDLVLNPVAHTRTLEDARESDNENNNTSMTPTCLLDRRQDFHNSLLEITKDYHEEYLQSLNPPMIIPRNKLTRWHPGFGLDQVPDITPEPLPEPPNVEKYSTAKDVLEKAKNLFNCNQRMEKALKLVSEQSTSTESPKTPNNVNVPPVPDLLKGIPKALLEKVRAKQAAKALEAMTRSPAQARDATQHIRLPELARILRNLFVAEKKSVLQLDFVLDKLSHSYRERLSKDELQEHIRLIVKAQPEWLKILQTRKMYFLRLSKDRDMSLVTKHLEGLAVKKSSI